MLKELMISKIQIIEIDISNEESELSKLEEELQRIVVAIKESKNRLSELLKALEVAEND